MIGKGSKNGWRKFKWIIDVCYSVNWIALSCYLHMWKIIRLGKRENQKD